MGSGLELQLSDMGLALCSVGYSALGSIALWICNGTNIQTRAPLNMRIVLERTLGTPFRALPRSHEQRYECYKGPMTLKLETPGPEIPN